MLKFQNCQATIQDIRILCQSASISEQASISPIYSLGFKGPINSSTNNPLKNTFQLDYIIETISDWNSILLSYTKNYDFSQFPTTIVVGNITGVGYLDSYRLEIIPNEPIKASASYSIFNPLSGYLNEQPSFYPDIYNIYNGSGIGHSWTTYAKKSDNSLTGSLIQCSYSIKLDWQPVYKIGSKFPVEVKFLKAEENFNITNEYNLKIKSSGETFENVFNDIEVIEINNISSAWDSLNSSNVKLYPVSGKIITNNINISENNLITQETTIQKFY